MKSFKIMLITVLSVMTLSCSEKTTTEIPETELKNISCSTQLVTHSSAQTRGAAPTTLNENDFVLYAFKKTVKVTLVMKKPNMEQVLLMAEFGNTMQLSQ